MATAALRTAPVVPTPEGCRVRGFDFDANQEVALELAAIAEARATGLFIWIDLDLARVADAAALLADLNLLSADAVDELLQPVGNSQLTRCDEYVHFALSGRRKGHTLERLDCILSTRTLLTVHRGDVLFLHAMERSYRHDFVRFARTPSFLIYELWDKLADNYVAAQQSFEERVEAMQRELMTGAVDDRALANVSLLSTELLQFRKVVLPARAVLADLASRRSLEISDITRGFLSNVLRTIDRVLEDISVDREILAEALSLHMSLMGHRTNQVMQKLTVVSVIFLPLTFLCGVYGMNFDVLPELHWRYGYAAFWAMVTSIVIAIVWLSKRTRLW